MSEGDRPIGEVLSGQEIAPLPKGWTVLEVFVVAKCIDDGGHVASSFRTTGGFSEEELLGFLVVHTERLRQQLVDGYSYEDDDEED